MADVFGTALKLAGSLVSQGPLGLVVNLTPPLKAGAQMKGNDILTTMTRTTAGIIVGPAEALHAEPIAKTIITTGTAIVDLATNPNLWIIGGLIIGGLILFSGDKK